MVDPKAFALAVIASAALTTGAFAADLLPPPPAMEPPPPQIYSAETGGWYLRGDVGLGINNTSGFTTSPDALQDGLHTGFLASGSTEGYYNTSLSESAMLDMGVGYQVNSWFRADVTAELRGGAEFQGLEVLNSIGGGSTTQAQYADFYRGHLTTYLGMVNAYADLGTWSGITPYVGAGVGVAYNRISGLIDYSPEQATGGYLEAKGQANFAWALMAGLDYSVTRNLKLEFGYRYLDYGKFSSGISHCLAGANSTGAAFSASNCSSGGVYLASKELTSNDFRIGLRYYLDSSAPTSAPFGYESAPLVRKY